MIIKVSELKEIPEFRSVSEKVLERKINAIEKIIRSHSNNNFQKRSIRFEACSAGKTLYGYNQYLKIGDTIQISESINDGLYVIAEIDKQSKIVVLDRELYQVGHNLITKVEYPDDVVEGAINMLDWEIKNRGKVGIKSETLSRHSVTYFDQDANNQVAGYPVSLLGFLQPHMKARF